MISIPQILATALRHPKVLVSLRRALSSSLVTANPYHRQIVAFVSDFWDKNKTLPLPGDFEFWISTLDDQKQEGLRITLAEITNQPPENWTPDHIAREVTSVLKETASRNAVARLGTMVPNIPPTAIAELAEEIKSIEPITLEGIMALADVERHSFQVAEPPKLSTGFPSLDGLVGGFRRKELVFVMADTGIGKTALLVNFSAAAVLRGARVLYLTFELSAENTLRRHYRRIAEMGPGDYRAKPEVVVDRVKHWLAYAKGSAHILYQKPYSVSSDALEALVDQFVDLNGGIDLLILDYLDLMKPPIGHRERHEALGQLSHMVRNLGHVYDCTVMSATQAGRVAHGQRHIRLDMIGESYQKAQAADIIIGFVQTEEEAAANQARVSPLKVRENPGRGIEFPVYVNLDLMYIADLDHPNTKRLVELYRHTPQPVFTDD